MCLFGQNRLILVKSQFHTIPQFIVQCTENGDGADGEKALSHGKT